MFEKDQNSCSENSQEKKGGEVSHAGLRADSAQLFSCAETTGPRQNRRGSPLTSEHQSGSISLCSSHYYRVPGPMV